MFRNYRSNFVLFVFTTMINFLLNIEFLYIVMSFVYGYFIPDQQTKAYWSYNKEKVKSFKYNKVLDKNSVTITMCSL